MSQTLSPSARRGLADKEQALIRIIRAAEH